MAKLHKKVIGILRRHFGKVTDLLEDVDSTGRVLGAVVSPVFKGMDFDERQRRLSAALEAGLTPEEEQNVGPIAALTPAEASVKAMW